MTIARNKFIENATDRDLLDAWRAGDSDGKGFGIGDDDEDDEDKTSGQTPTDAALAEGYTVLRDLDPLGSILCTDDNGIFIVVCNGYGPWAVKVA
jgi:hypothetical protein